MYKKILLLLFVLLTAHAATKAFAPIDTSLIVKPMVLEGPRVGFSYIMPGKLADKLKNDLDVNPFITQFGWQFENRYFSLPNGTSGLVETVILIGGLEQGVFLPSGSFLIGIRNKNGTEFGFGPNLSLSGASFVLAFGSTIQSEYINFPFNIAFVPSSDGFRISFLTGFNARKK